MIQEIQSDILPGIKQFDLTGKSAIITGGSRGLGLAMAAGLASAGCEVMLVNRHDEEGKIAAAKLHKDFGVKIFSFAADITNQSETEAMAQAAITAFGKIDILINSAGINIRGPIDEVSYEDFNKVMTVNVNGTWLSSRAVVPFMKEQKSGRLSISPVP